MWNNLTPQQQQYLMAMLMGHQGGMPAQGMPAGMPGAQGGVNPAMVGQMQPGINPALGNPLMAGGNSAVSPQQQAAMMQYQQLLNGPQGWGATANSNVPLWQLMMGRSPMYGTGGAVP